MYKKLGILVSLFFLSACSGSRLNNTYKVRRTLYDVEQEKYREAYLNNHPDITRRLYWLISHESVEIGMTTEEVRASIGVPFSEKKSGHLTYWQFHERLIVFRDGIVIFFQK